MIDMQIAMKKTDTLLFVFLLGTSLMADNFGEWFYYRDLTINTSAGGADISTSQMKFPLLVRLSAADSSIFNAALSNGADIRFSGVGSSGGIGIHYPHQIELWDRTNKIAALWVLVDTLKGNSTTQRVRMFWGKSDAADSSSASAVFDTANGFNGVWHLSGGNFNDATANGFTAVDGGTTDTEAVIGGGRKFDNNDPDSIKVNGLLNSAKTLTLSCWAKVDTVDSGKADLISIANFATLRVAGNGSSDAERDSLVSFYYDTTGTWPMLFQPGGANVTVKAGWKHLAYVCNPSGSVQSLYVNGSRVAMGTSSTKIAYTSGSDYNTFFGRHGTAGRRDADLGGCLDEVRIDKTARSADWIALCCQNQKTGSTMLTAGAITPIAPSSLRYPVNPVEYYVNVTAAANTPTCVGAVDSFTIEPPLPEGLSINPSTGSIAGTPRATAAIANYVVTAKNKTGYDTETVVITVYGAPTKLAYSSDSVSYVLNTAITANVPTCTGIVDSFAVSPQLPAGLLFDKTSGAITGTPAAETEKASYTVTAYNPAGKATVILSITVISTLEAPADLHYRRNALSCIVNTAIVPDTPMVTGTVTAWTVAPSLPEGLSFDTTNGIIAGTPTVIIERTDYMITASNSAGSARDTVSIVVAHDISAPENSLRISGEYMGDTSVNVYLDSISSIDTSRTAVIEVQYDFSDSVNFTTSTFKEISAADAVREAINDRYTITLVNPLFAGGQRPLYCAVSLKGVNAVQHQENNDNHDRQGASEQSRPPHRPHVIGIINRAFLAAGYGDRQHSYLVFE
ncbi:MAG: DUF2341 domain-containing protein [Chitinispirillaceae bacterium]|nr:DUF2341 domain-containing protein [Chitinispirillaceae bacterium]